MQSPLVMLLALVVGCAYQTSTAIIRVSPDDSMPAIRDTVRVIVRDTVRLRDTTVRRQGIFSRSVLDFHRDSPDDTYVPRDTIRLPCPCSAVLANPTDLPCIGSDAIEPSRIVSIGQWGVELEVVYWIVRPGCMTLQLRDVDGKILRRFADGAAVDGRHLFTFDARTIVAGTYRVVLTTQGGEDIRTVYIGLF